MSGNILEVKITGTRPLLMNSPKNVGLPKSNIKQTIYDPDEEATKLLYLDREGKCCIPNLNMLACIRKAATDLKAAGRGRKTLKEFVYSGLRVQEEFILLDPQ